MTTPAQDPTTPTTPTTSPVALVTGGTAGLGLALVRDLAADGWLVVTDGRSAERLREAARLPSVTALTGDVTDPDHRRHLAEAVHDLGRLDLLVHNASSLGPLPMRPLDRVSAPELSAAWEANVLAAHELNRLLVPTLAAGDGVLVSLSSDVVLEHLAHWGPYAATKAALDHLTLTTGVEQQVTAYVVDPGDMRTRMHQDAFPEEDISDRPLPETVVPALRALLAERPASSRVRLADLAVTS